ncbi:TIGR02452 family protein [Liquorilactobacillus nagelii]|uniref:TIGR02452 family protein n=1 Tax=Liquorilactobacillus nagelii TaxID=82688 RepID=UPI00242ACDBA|nr:TIGR02452 family protein [Liquorilactobacillus nagelii]MCI1700147.1 TIGR02452 family protein [Liquorilactobacillus nagelii]
MTNLTSEDYRNIAHHTMNLYQIEMNDLPQHSKLVSNLLAPIKPRFQQKTRIFVENENLLQRLKKISGAKTVGILNFASPIDIGGNFKQGINAQEQTICRNSYLYPELCTFRREYYYYNQQHENHGFYTRRMIVSYQVKFLRDETEKQYLKPARSVDVISMAAPDISLMRREKYQPTIEQIQSEFKWRITQFLRQFSILGDNDLILGAFGCGSFQNDPQLVAGVFKDVLQSTEFATAFKNIYFSITDLKQTEVFATALADQSHPLVKQG